MIAVIGILAALLMPALTSARAAADRMACANNLRQLHAANTLYAAAGNGYAPAAPDIWEQNLKRWHGARTSAAAPFDPVVGPLWSLMGHEERLRRCPSFRNAGTNGFEAGCGGYGYNAYGVGSQSYLYGSIQGAARGMSPGSIRQPAATVMFADAAFPQSDGTVTRLIEYSFAEPYRHIADRQPAETYQADPSIHFRHGGAANVAWCDGHVTAERMTLSKKAGGFESWNIGWFGGPDNELFDPY